MDFNLNETRTKRLNNYNQKHRNNILSAKQVRISDIINNTSMYISSEKIKINGRVMEVKKLKRNSYVTLKDFNSRIQLHCVSDIHESMINCIDTGDWIEVIGEVIYNGKSYIVEVTDYRLVAKCRFTFPKQLNDKKKRYQNRFLDFTINDKALEVARCSALISQVIRRTLWKKGFSEYNTPELFTNFNGGVSTPFTTQFNAMKKAGYLKVTSEIYLKQLISAGFDSVFEIAGSYRNDGIDKYHIPGFPLLEVYKAFSDAEYMLELNIEMIENILREYNGSPCIILPDNTTLSVKKEDWRKVNAYEILKAKTGIDILSDIYNLRIQARRVGVECSEYSGPATVIGNLIDQFIRAGSVSPLIITHLPATMTPLMKRSNADNRFADRFWLYLNGIDISDIGSEQDDFDAQIQALQEQFDMMHDAYPHIKVNQDIVKVISYGLPEMGGIGFSLSRLLMAITNTNDVRETPIFPYV